MCISPSFLSQALLLLISSYLVVLQLLALVSSLEPGLILAVQASCCVDVGWYRVTCLSIYLQDLLWTPLPCSFMISPGSSWQQLFFGLLSRIGGFTTLLILSVEPCYGLLPYMGYFESSLFLTCLCQLLQLEHRRFSSSVWFTVLSLVKFSFFTLLLASSCPNVSSYLVCHIFRSINPYFFLLEVKWLQWSLLFGWVPYLYLKDCCFDRY